MDYELAPPHPIRRCITTPAIKYNPPLNITYKKWFSKLPKEIQLNILGERLLKRPGK